MAKRKIWILGTLAVVVAVGAFLYGRYDRGGTFPTLGAGVNGVSPEVTKQCQDVTIGYIPDKGVIIPDESLCQISAFSQFGTFSTMDAAQQYLEEIQTEHSQLFLGHDLVVWSDQTPDLDTVYSVRTGFADEMDANQFCALANKQGLDCTVVPVIVNNQPTLGAGTPSPDDPEPVDPEIDKMCQDGELQYDPARGVIVSARAQCMIDAFSQFGVFNTRIDAENMRENLIRQHPLLFIGSAPIVWTDTTPRGDIAYSLRIGFIKESVAEQFCELARENQVSCTVVPVIINGGI